MNGSHVSTDAKPDPALCGHDTNGRSLGPHASLNSFPEPENNEPEIDFPEPPEDWEFNNFLSDIASCLVDVDLETIKYLFIGTIARRVLEKVTSFNELFLLLRNHTFLSRDNLIYLQKCLKQAGRIDLVMKTVDFAKRMGNVLHFYPASALPENGYEFVKCHIDGKDFKNCKRQHLDNLRAKLSRTLCVPPEFVVFAGIEPSSSLLITVMIPEEYIQVLEYVLENSDGNEDFLEVGIDVIQTEAKSFKLEEKQVSVVDDTEEQRKLTTVYQQLQQKCQLIETTELKLLEGEKQLANLSMKVQKAEADAHKAAEVVNMLKASMEQSTIEAHDLAQRKERIKDFESLLDEAKENGYTTSSVKKLLEINTYIVSRGIADSYLYRERRLSEELRRMQSVILPMQFELQKYKAFTTEDGKQAMLKLFENLMASLNLTVEQEIKYELMEDVLANLREISRSLRPNDRKMLEKDYQWKSDEPIKQQMKRDNSFFLAGILHKEIEKQGQLIDPGPFISQCLHKIGREDLNQRYLHLENKRHSKPSSGPSQQVLRKKSKAKPRSKNPQEEQKKQRQTHTEFDNNMRQLIETMAEQIKVIHDTMQSMTSSYNEELDPWNSPSLASKFESGLFTGTATASGNDGSIPRSRNQSGEQLF